MSGESGAAAGETTRPRRWGQALKRALAPSRALDWVISLVLVVASIGLALVQVPQHATVSPFDEYVYIDYLDKVPTQLVVHRGEETGQYARLYLSCHGVRTIGYYPAEFCSNWQPADVKRMPNEGITTADIYTPVYFGATWLMAQPVQWLGVNDLTEAGRYTGWTWLAAAAVLLYLALRRLKVAPLAAGSLGLLLIGSLPAYWSNTYISTDATALLAGSLMLFGVSLFMTGSRHASWLLVVFGVFVTLAKLQNLIAVAVAVVVLMLLALVGAWRGGRGTRLRAFLADRRTWAAATTLVSSIAVQAVWVVIRSAIAVAPSPDQGVGVPLGRKALVAEMFSFFPRAAQGARKPDLMEFPAVIPATILTWVIVAGVLGLLAVARRGSFDEVLALSTFVVALTAGPLLAVATTLVAGYYFVLPHRYGVSLLPFMLACAGLLFTRSAWFHVLLPACALVSYAATLNLLE